MSSNPDRPNSYETQTDDPEVLELLAAVDDVLNGFTETVNWKTRDKLRRQLRAVIWRTLMETVEA